MAVLPVWGLDGPVALRRDFALSVLGDSQSVHHPAQEALAHRHAGGFQRPADHASGGDLLAAAEEDAAHAIPAQILHHALHAGAEQQYFAVLGVIQALDGGDFAVHRRHLADLLGGRGHGPVLYRMAHQGQDVVGSAFQPPDVVPELPHPALQGPVVHVRPHLEAEALLQRRVLLPLQGNFPLVLVRQKFLKAPELLLRGLDGAAELRLEAASSGPHGLLLPPPNSGIGRRGPCRPSPSASSPRPPSAPAAPAGTPG